MDSERITIAVSKGRIYAEAVPLLAAAGFAPEESPGRRLILETSHADVQLLIIRASDVPTYVARGAADLGITGRDILMEYRGNAQPFYEPLDLGIACCRMMLAGPNSEVSPPTDTAGRLRVATKYPCTTRDWFARQGRQIDIIRLYGSMELAPLLGLADQIVDLVATGHTLKANNLVALSLVAEISARLIANKAALRLKGERVVRCIERLQEVLSERQPIP